MSLSKEGDKKNVFEKLLSGYTKLLQEKPILTKSVTRSSSLLLICDTCSSNIYLFMLLNK